MKKTLQKILFRILFNEYERTGIAWALKREERTCDKLASESRDYESSARYKRDAIQAKILYDRINSILPKEDKKWGM